MDDTASATVDGDGAFGRNTVEDFTVTYSPLSAVGNDVYATKNGTTYVRLQWVQVPQATSYNIRRCTATSGPCAPVYLANTTSLFYNDAVQGNANHYWYSIQAVYGACLSP